MNNPSYQDEFVTLYHGDCLDILKGIETGSADTFITDPPYGIDYQSARRIDRADWKPKIANDGLPFIWWLYDARRITKDAGALACFCRWDVQEEFRMAIRCAGFDIKSQCIWDREAHGMGDLEGAAAPQHDIIWLATLKGFKFHGPRLKSILRSPRIGAATLVHPNEKPYGLMEQLVSTLCPKGGIIVDAFCGYGATLVAAKHLRRRAIGIDSSAEWIERTAKRLETVHPYFDYEPPPALTQQSLAL